MRYLSLFSGAGGLEHARITPILACETDAACVRVLQRRMKSTAIHRDVLTLSPSHAEFVVGGWPCQDISSAGSMRGISGDRSGLFFRMIDIALESEAHTVIGENVPHLLTIHRGRDFEGVIKHLTSSGYRFVSWRTLNAREFGLPQDRRRIFIVASKHREFARAIHGEAPQCVPDSVVTNPRAAGFYWTGGGRSICFSRGFTPALKVGASDSKGRSVVALFRDGKIRKLSAAGCARLQGFDPSDFKDESKTDTVRMAGNAVPVPMGNFVLDLVFSARRSKHNVSGVGVQTGFGRVTEHGFAEGGMIWSVDHSKSELANNLDDLTRDDEGDDLSSQAAAGLIVRSVRSNKPLPVELLDALLSLSEKSRRYRGARSNSFEALERLNLEAYRRSAAITPSEAA